MSLPWLRKIASLEEYDELVKRATEDNHSVCGLTHVIARDKEVVGYASIGAIPLTLCWLDTKKVRARESLGLMNLAENLVSLGGAPGMLVAVQKTSPFHPLMESVGYGDCGNYDLFLKSF